MLSRIAQLASKKLQPVLRARAYHLLGNMMLELSLIKLGLVAILEATTREHSGDQVLLTFLKATRMINEHDLEATIRAFEKVTLVGVKPTLNDLYRLRRYLAEINQGQYNLGQRTILTAEDASALVSHHSSNIATLISNLESDISGVGRRLNATHTPAQAQA